MSPSGSYTPSTKAASFHDRVMSFKDSLHSHELRQLLSSITMDEFQELREASASVILPIVVDWLYDPVTQSLALVYLWETAKQFPALFRRAENSQLILKCYSALDGVSSSDTFSPEEITQIREFIALACSRTTSPAMSWSV
ncbi:uncharacterized protein ACA1_093040 [Acanthamoeba castellanii str. Neff]|uniref:Uncharacterized protein n=1 Tax=Acanthamoeba castellanii (strain ATCC 30010 / Neff) TaxID=1257118 RepID=L8GIT9_ACACF|nr:uncharacterized protein ACA1_093040 [Acanthamoeba castellanii str. Neff]ELR12769.1 hypothetical protein ACA1_093040 [Acanthamoeba castellanii str. Neff]